MPTPPDSNLLLWFSADQGVTLDPNGRVSAWDSVQAGLPSVAQAGVAGRPALVSDVFNGYPGIQFSEGTFLGVQDLETSGADFTLFVLGSSLSEHVPKLRVAVRNVCTM